MHEQRNGDFFYNKAVLSQADSLRLFFIAGSAIDWGRILDKMTGPAVQRPVMWL